MKRLRLYEKYEQKESGDQLELLNQKEMPKLRGAVRVIEVLTALANMRR
jgi:hypothetical protein